MNASRSSENIHSSVTGYLHPLYAKSLSEFGNPVELPQCRGWLLERRIPNSDMQDAMGCYPLFCCQNWTALANDIRGLRDRYVTISLVIDPFAPIDAQDLSPYFQIVKPFKNHFVIEICNSTDRNISQHHRYYARRALKNMQVTVTDDPTACLDDWTRLYRILVERHCLKGIKAFSKTAFVTQFEVPGLMVFRASIYGRIIGMHLWYLQSGIAYSHLGASDQEGYALGAAYALYWTAINVFKRDYARKLQWIDLGAAAGAHENDGGGLSMFKRGWATGEKAKYFCGFVSDLTAYKALITTKVSDSSYFPLYRADELS